MSVDYSKENSKYNNKENSKENMEKIPDWAKQLIKIVNELKTQVSINCSKLDKMDNKLDQLQEIGEKNQNSLDVLIKQNRQHI